VKGSESAAFYTLDQLTGVESRMDLFVLKPIPDCKMMGRKYDKAVEMRLSKKNMTAKP
jgi:hypothetical protein